MTLQNSENPTLNLGHLALMRFKLRAEEHFEAAHHSPPAATVIQAGLGSTLFRSRREERRPLLFDLRTTTLGALDLALLMFGES
jgi:hypothetical protein